MACTMEPTKKFKTELRFLARDVGYVGLLLQKEVQKCMAKFDSTGDTGLLCRKLAKLFNTYSNHMNQYAKDLTERINKAGKEVEHREALECLQHLICKKSELNCINCGQNGTSSGPLIENPAIEPTNNHVSTEQEVDYALSQGSSVHLGNEVKDEQAASQEETQTDNGAFIDLSVIDSTSSERSTNESSSTIVYNSSEKHSQQLEEDQNLDNDPNTEETIGSSLGDIFEEESAPSNLPDIDPEQSRPTNDLDKTANTSSDIRSAEVDDVHAANNEHLPHGSEDVVSSSERTKQKHSSIDESDDDDIEIVTSTSATVPNTVATAVSSPASSEETVANSPAEVAKSHDSDATVASLSPPQESRREWNVTASNDLLDQSGGTSTDFSQVFELSKDKSAKESVGNHEDDADFDVLTQVASKTKEIDDANAKSADSDVDFDLDTQPAVTDACDNIVDADSDVDFDAPTQVSLEKAIDRQEELSDKTDSLLSEGQDESGTKPSEVKKDAVTLDKPTTDGDVNADLVGCDSAEKLEFLKSLAVIPRDSPENNGQHDKSAPEHANANKESSRVPLEDLDKSKKPSSEADRSSAPEGTSHSDSDILGDISGSDTSGEETKSKPKKKLTPKDKESVMKLISEFYSKRKLERMGLLEEHPEKTAKKPQRRRRKPRKLSTSPNKSENTSKSSKKLLEESDDEVKTATSKSRSESVQDDMEIHEVISSDNQATTQITTVVQPTTESASDKIIDDHSDNSGDSAQKSKVIASAVNGTTDVDKIDDIEDLEATQRVDIRTLKWLSEGSSNMPIWDERAPERANSDGTNQLMNPSKPTTTPSDVIALSSTESDSSPVVEPFKRKAVLPLPNTQSDADSISTDVEDSSQVVKPFRKKPVQPLPATQSDAADTDDVEASSQVVKPVRNKPVCTQTDDESPQLSFKRKAVLPLTSSHSDSEGSSGGTNVQRKSFKRTRHSSEPSKTSDEVDFEAETQAGSTPADTDDCSEGSTQEQPPPAKRARTCSKDSEIIIEKPSSSGSSSSEGDDLPQEDESLPSSESGRHRHLHLDDNGRDDLLEMLNQREIVSNRGDQNLSPRPHDTYDNGAGEEHQQEMPQSQFKLCDSDRDNLLNLLTDKERDERKEVKVEVASSQFRLGDEDRDELLDLLNGVDKDRRGGSETSEHDCKGPNTAKVDQEMAKALVNNEGDLKQATEDFKLTDQDKDELLAFLIERMNEEAVSSGEDDCDDVKTQLDDKDAVPGEKRKATEENTEPAKRRRAIEGLLNKDTLLELLEEFEEAQRKQGGVTPIDQVSITVATKSPANALTTDMGLDLLLENLYWDSEKDSEEASVLLDFVREEAVDASETDCSKRGPGRPKDNSKEAWQAYQSLLKEDDRMSDTSSDSSDGDLDLNDLGMNPDFSDKVSRQAQGARNVELLRTFGIHKELIIDLEELDVSGYDDLRSSRLQRGDSVDRLCDLSNMLQKRIKGGASHRRPKLKRLQSQSSNSSSGESAESDDEESESSEDDDSDSSIQAQRESTPHIISDDDDFERLANALWDDIKNSSDDQSDGSGSPEEGVSSGSESEKKGKRSSPKGGGSKTKASKALKSDGSGGSTTSSSSSSNSSSSSSSSESDDDKDNKKETTDSIIQKADLDSSDEEDFVGVRKGRGAWRHDPLLKGCITTTSDDSDSEQLGAPANKRLHKRRQKRLKSESQDGSDSDVTVVEEDSKTPVKKPFQFISSDDSDFEIIETQKTPLKTIVITDEEDTPGKKGKGRRNIRALVEEDDLAEATQRANNEERERIRRLQERDKAKKSFTQSQSFSSQLTEDDPDPMVLDVYDDVQIKVHPKIVQKLKPHQRRGIEFMWDSCYLSLKDLKEEGYRGSGCILAHCMGLGKTLQALALIQALFSCALTKTKHVLVVCPLSTVLNWRNEYNLAYKDIKHSRVKLYTIENTKVASRRLNIVTKWWRTGGVLVLGYECFGLLSNESKLKKWENQTAFNKEDILKALVDPGPDLVICDEGHLLRNKQSQRTLALNQVKTKRRIVLTGTPLQNNLLEYYNMVQFVKEDILGNEKEFKTNFVNPITNGQFEDSTAEDIMFMKKRTHCLHKILANTVQRVEDTELKQYLPKLVDQAVFVKLSDLQVKLYNTYLDAVNSRPVVYTKSGQVSHKNFLADVQILRYICLHPNVVTIAEKNSKSKIKEQDVIEDNLEDDVEEKVVISKGDWYKDVLEPDETKKLESGSKLMVAISIMREAAANGDKVLIFSQSYAEMDSLEAFMSQQLDYKKGRDYYRMDGTISPEVRTHMCDKFNAKDIKVFIMSTKVGGLGLNLTAANRILIMNVNWNPSWDTQSVFRSFRFGQTKAVYVYRLVALDTMEEKMYQRVVTKLAVAHRVVDKHQITRHYSAADIQEFYSARPVIEKNRPVPNVPEDKVLASLIQRHQFVFRWHEHQALLANRPEEDLDEQQKNAAWDEYNKKSIEPTLPQVSLGATAPMLPTNAPASSSAQPGPSGLHNQVNAGRPNRPRGPPKRKAAAPAGAPRLPNNRAPNKLPEPDYRNEVERARTIRDINKIIRDATTGDQIHVLSPANSSGRLVGSTTAGASGIDELNSIITESLSDSWANDGMNFTLATLDMPEFPSASLHPDHNYSLPKNTLLSFRTRSSDYFRPFPEKIPPIIPRPEFVLCDGDNNNNYYYDRCYQSPYYKKRAVMHPRTIPPDEILRAIQLRYTPRQPFGPSPTGVGGTNAVRQLVPTPKPKQVDGGGGIFAPPGVGGANAARHTVATPKPKQVDVGGGIFAPPGVGGANAVRHPVPVATPKSKQVDVGGCGTFAPPGVGGANAARHPVATPKPKQVDIGGGISISREEPNSATAPPPPPAHVQKPSVSIHSSTAPIPINLSKKTHNGAIQRINGSNAHDIVQNPANAHVMLSRKIEAMKGLINNNNATPSKRNGAIQQNQFNGKVSDTQNYIGLKEAPRPDVTHIKIQSLKAKTLAKMKSHALKMKGRPPKHIMTPRLTKPTQAPPPLVVTNSPVSASSSPNNNPSPANHQSPLQKQMRTFMDHLHRLQKQMEAGTPPAAKTTTELEPSILNKHKLPSSMSIVRVSPKAASNGNRTSASHAPSSLGAARNLSSFAHAQKQSLERIKGCGSAPKKVAANHKPVVRVIGPMPNQGGGATRKMRINGIPVTKVVQPISPNIVKRLVNKQLVPPLSPGAKKVIISQKLGSSPGHQRVVSAQPTIGGSPLQKRMVANFNKLTKAAITPPASPPSRFKNSANLKTYQHKKNGHHQSFRTSPFWCASGAPAAPVTSAASISNKENIKKKRVPMRSVNGATVAASIDLSKEKGSGSDSPLSQEVVNTLKRKGVSINYVGKEAVNSEGVIQLD